MAVIRVLPKVGHLDRAFWTGGEHGQLLVTRCQACALWIHPPKPRCPRCLGAEVVPEPTSGRGTVHTFTINHQEWNPTHEHPYVIAVVELDEQPGLRLATNIVDADPDAVSIGMRVEVSFVADDDVWLPMFRPVEQSPP